jgi:molecular chaperone HscB
MQNHFERLGIPRRFSVDLSDLERAYLTLSRSVHPDYHLAGSDNDLAASLDLSASLNESYNILRDPFARAEYLLSLEGGPSGRNLCNPCDRCRSTRLFEQGERA